VRGGGKGSDVFARRSEAHDLVRQHGDARRGVARRRRSDRSARALDRRATSADRDALAGFDEAALDLDLEAAGRQRTAHGAVELAPRLEAPLAIERRRCLVACAKSAERGEQRAGGPDRSS